MRKLNIKQGCTKVVEVRGGREQSKFQDGRFSLNVYIDFIVDNAGKYL